MIMIMIMVMVMVINDNDNDKIMLKDCFPGKLEVIIMLVNKYYWPTCLNPSAKLFLKNRMPELMPSFKSPNEDRFPVLLTAKIIKGQDFNDPIIKLEGWDSTSKLHLYKML